MTSHLLVELSVVVQLIERGLLRFLALLEQASNAGKLATRLVLIALSITCTFAVQYKHTIRLLITGGSAHFAGMGSPVSAVHMLQRNPDSLLTALVSGSTSCNSCNNSSGTPAMAAVYLWDLRRPWRPAASLDLPDSAVNYAQAASVAGINVECSQAGCDSLMPTSVADGHIAQGAGALCVAVHGDGILAAAGCQDGRVLLWDMRKVCR